MFSPLERSTAPDSRTGAVQIDTRDKIRSDNEVGAQPGAPLHLLDGALLPSTPALHLLHKAPGEAVQVRRGHGGVLRETFDAGQVGRRLLIRRVDRHRRTIRVGCLGDVTAPLERQSEIVSEPGYA